MGRNLRRSVALKENVESVPLKRVDAGRRLKALTIKKGSTENNMPTTRKKRSPVPSKTRPRLALADKTNSTSPKSVLAAAAPAKRPDRQKLPRSATLKKFGNRSPGIQPPEQKRICSKQASHPIRKNSSLVDTKENEQPKAGSSVERARKRKIPSTEEGGPIAEKISATSDGVSHLAETLADSADDSYEIEDEWDGRKFLGFEDDDPDIEQNMFIEWVDRYKKAQAERCKTFVPTPAIKSLSSFPTKRSERLVNCKDPTLTANTGEAKSEEILQGTHKDKSESGHNFPSPKIDKNAVSKMSKESLVTAGRHMTRSESQRETLLQKEQFVKHNEPIGDNHLRAKKQKPNKASEAAVLKNETPKVSPTSETKKSPRALAPLFSVFNKSLSPRNHSTQNKIFVSRRRDSLENAPKPQPVYVNPALTPIGKKKQLPVEEKVGLYEFEVDENEPKPKKKHRPILKIQRMRQVNKKKKPNNYIVDPEVEKRVLRNLDMSPSVLGTAKAPPVQNTTESLATVAPGQPSSSNNHSVLETDAHTSTNTSAHVATTASGLPSSSTKLQEAPISAKSTVETSGENKSRENTVDDGHETDDDHFDPCPPSPANFPPSSTPAHRSIDRLMDDTVDKYGRLSGKMYSPVAANNSSLPVLFASRSRSVMMTPNASRMSGGSHECLPGLLGDVGASTPIKKREDDSTIIQERQPLKADISNCFGFDEPESFEEPLVSPIKRHIRLNYDRPVAPSPTRTFLEFRRKPPINSPHPSRCVPPVDVKEVIDKLKAEVGQDPNSSETHVAVFSEDCEKQKPIKRFFQAEPEARPDPVVNESSVVQDDSIFQSLPLPRASYSRPARTRKRKVVPEMEYNELSMCHSSENESGGSEDEDGKEEEPVKKKKKVAFKTKKVITSKKKDKGAMNKKEEEELEKWAQQFNSQCAEISDYGLCVE